jgi:hypothetical protein
MPMKNKGRSSVEFFVIGKSTPFSIVELVALLAAFVRFYGFIF